MKTVSLKMPEEEVKTLEKIARKEGKSKSALLRDLAKEGMKKRTAPTLRKIVGVLSEKEAKEIEKVLEERKKGWWKRFPRESPFSSDFG